MIETRIGEQILNEGWKIQHVPSFSEFDLAQTTGELPEVVICPLIFGRFDAIDVGLKLAELSSQPKLWVISPRLPKPAMVLQEIRAACPILRIEIRDEQLRPIEL